ncbi:SusE domain-containing protein [Nonlabens sp. SCSIO 43208]|uniref:SusF/SusE family outer membrane protein n=1 Tax=Nonlabens TaxID=363408 RepID=UPI000A203C5D|nr:SusE domain-containing protein [Nonlabens tegetincola]ARN71872.1 hypothetical protein BST91_09540 [Nonlabens tegetincola]
MKKISVIMFAFLAIAGIISCEDNDSEEFTINTAPSGEVMLSPDVVNFEVTETNGNTLAERFVWNDLEMEVPVQVNYELQMDVENGDFSAPQVIGSTTENNLAILYSTLNNAATQLGGEHATPGNYSIRLVASVADPAVEPVISNLVNAIITPFSAYPFTDLYLVGAATAPGWNNDNDNPALYRDPANDNVFYYSGYFVGDAFKILTSPGFWQPQYGESNGAVGLNDGAGSDPGVFSIPADGYYDFTIDITGVTNSSQGSSSFSIAPNANGASATTYTSVGIIGDGTPTGWGSDTDMVQSTFDPHKWSITNVSLISGFMKFRANDDWAVNWGSDTELTGQGTQDGPNIPVEPGTYDIYFNDLDGRYILIPVR